MKQLRSKLLSIPIMLLAALMLAACSGGGGGGGGGGGSTGDAPSDPVTTPVKSLDQAGYNPSATAYQYGFSSIQNIPIANAPADTDYSRWAMLHSGGNYHLYFFKRESNTQIYQFIYDAGMTRYDHNFPGNIKVIDVTGAPADADPSSFAMLHDGIRYRLYMRGKANPMRLYQFAYNTAAGDYQYGFNSINQINITGAPANADFSGWAMLHDGTRYRLYAFNPANPEQIYQFAFNGSTYAYGFDSINILSIQNMPADADKTDFAMLHDGANYRFYYRRR